ncbi:MAG: C1 family peptidase [Rhodobacter sp.]|nr:C1 family peptidase [Rhodobacter sp.]
MPRRGPRRSRLVLNCIKSSDTDRDWALGDAAGAELIDETTDPPEQIDLRADWWTISDQGNSGACVGFATADGVLRWLYVTRGMMDRRDKPSARFIWMANKETDDLTSHPTTFLDTAGTSTKLALKVARKYGCVPDNMLKMQGKLSKLNPTSFFAVASQYRIDSFYNLYEGVEEDQRLVKLKSWISTNGPVLTRLEANETFRKYQPEDGILEFYDDSEQIGGHAVCFVGYTPDHFIVRNSWGENWGHGGFGYVSNQYVLQAFDEAYGAILNKVQRFEPP